MTKELSKNTRDKIVHQNKTGVNQSTITTQLGEKTSTVKACNENKISDDLPLPGSPYKVSSGIHMIFKNAEKNAKYCMV